MKNINPKTNPVTTYIGIIFLLVALAIFTLPMFIQVKEQQPLWIPSSIGLLGLCLLLIPDDIRGALRKIISRKSEQI